MLLTIGVADAADIVAVPPLQARVTDLTGTLTPDQRGQIESSLTQFEQTRGSQIAVLLLPSTKPETIEEYGIRLAEAWKLGRKGVDDGVIVIVAKEDRRLRFEVGYGLEGALNDATAKRIISETMAPRFKANDYFGGVQAGVAAIRTVIEAEALPTPGDMSVNRGKPGQINPSLDGNENILVIGLVVAALIGNVLRMIFGNLLGASVTAAGVGVAAWLITASLMSAVLAAGAGFFLSLFGINIAMSMLLSGRGGGSGGGGFRGGGGGFGGGGASGSW